LKAFFVDNGSFEILFVKTILINYSFPFSSVGFIKIKCY